MCFHRKYDQFLNKFGVIKFDHKCDGLHSIVGKSSCCLLFSW